MVDLALRFVRTAVILFVLHWHVPMSVYAQPVTQPFTFSLVEHTMPHVEHAVIALGDFDNDGDLDVYLAGIADGVIVAGLYRNDGAELRDGAPTLLFQKTDDMFEPLAYGSAAWGDYDGDGDLDLVVTGSHNIDPPYHTEAILYRNDGGEFVRTDALLEGYHSGTAAWGDFDNDGDLDLLLGGEGPDRTSGTRLYRNDEGTFVEVQTDLPGLAYGDAAWGDADGDGDLDLVMGGVGSDGIYADIYRNDGGSFSRIDSELTPSAFTEFDWGDFDRDGDLDVLQTGGFFSPNVLEGFTRIYRNSNAAFDSLEIALPGAVSGAGTWGDFDNDGDLDLFVMGASEDVFGRRLARIYVNEESGFLDKIHFVGVVFGSAIWGDIDGDGDLDLIVSGRPTVGDPFVNVYENRRQVVNPPIEPVNLAASVSPGSASLSWDAPKMGAGSFNLRVGSKSGRGDVVAPMADTGTGRRLISAAGNAQQNTSWVVRGLEPGTYFWSVQSLDFAYAASRFAPEHRFTISHTTSAERSEDVLPIETALHAASPNPSTGPVTIHYDLAHRSPVVIRIHDLLGRTVAVPVDQEQSRGRHTTNWDGRDSRGASVSSGLYLCELQSGTYRQSVAFVITR